MKSLHCDNEYDMDRPEKCACDCDDQIPVWSKVGRGIKGDSAHIGLSSPDTASETHVEGWMEDSATGEIHSQWRSENINGGQLSYQYNLRPYTNPRTFTITFIYRRPGRPEWSWTTPAIPYIWTLDPAGDLDDDPDHIVGSGVATLFIKTMHESEWHERLKYPDGTTREDFNAPNVGEAWVATIRFGKGGDIEVPDFDDLAKVIGMTKQQLFNILDGTAVTINGISAKNLVEYIDKCDRRDRDHFHKDLGFNAEGHAATGAFGGKDTVKLYIDGKDADLLSEINKLRTTVNNLSSSLTNANSAINALKSNIASLIYNATVGSDGSIHIPSGTKIPTGNINVFGDSGYIRTGADGDNDLMGS